MTLSNNNEYILKINDIRYKFQQLNDMIVKSKNERNMKYTELCECVIFNCERLIEEIEHIDIDELIEELYILNFEYEMVKYNINNYMMFS